MISALCPSLVLTNTEISTNSSYAVYSGGNTTITKTGNTAENNTRNGVYVRGGTSIDTKWQGNDLPYIVYSFTVGQNKTHTISKGTVVKFESPGYLSVYGALNAAGTADERIVFTSIKDDSFGGDTNNDATATVPARGSWYYIKFYDQSSDELSKLDNVVVRYGGYYGSIYLSSASTPISNSVIEHSSSAGIYIDGNSQPNITGNTLKDNRYGIHLSGSATANISGNTITDHTYLSGSSGIYLVGTSNANITQNTIANNNYGV